MVTDDEIILILLMDKIHAMMSAQGFGAGSHMCIFHPNLSKKVSFSIHRSWSL